MIYLLMYLVGKIVWLCHIIFLTIQVQKRLIILSFYFWYFFDLMLIEQDNKYHYTWIKSLSRLLNDQSKHKCKCYPCRKCLHIFSSEDILEMHKKDCSGIGDRASKIEMPKKWREIKFKGETKWVRGNTIKFKNHVRRMKVPFVIYADFECNLTKISGCANNPDKSNTQNTHKHDVSSYCYIIVRCDGKVGKPKVYRGPNAAEHFLKSLEKSTEKINKVFENPKPMIMTPADEENHKNATQCHICNKDFKYGTML